MHMQVKIMKERAQKIINRLEAEYTYKAHNTVMTFTKRNDSKLHAELLKRMETGLDYRSELWLIASPNKNICSHPECSARTKAARSWGKFKRYCSIKCGNSDPAKLKRSSQTCEKRYGTRNVSQVEDVKQKKRTTCRANYGVDYPQQADAIRAKLEANNLRKYGSKNVGQVHKFQHKRRKTFKRRFGVDNPWKATEVKAAIREVMLARYGVDHPSKVPEIMDRCISSRSNPLNLKAVKRTVDIQGKKFVCYGYEAIALRYMVEVMGIDVRHITNRKVRTFPYYDSQKQKMRRYYPDFKVKHNGEIVYVEVKSLFTLLGYQKFAPMANIVDKSKAVHTYGSRLMILVFMSAKSQEPIIKSVTMHNATKEKVLDVLAKRTDSLQVTRHFDV